MEENKKAMNINWYPRSYVKDQKANNRRYKINRYSN